MIPFYITRLTSSHFYIEILADQGEQSGGEVHLQVDVHRHVHPDKLLVGKPVRTFVSKPQRRIHVLQHVVHLRVMDLAGRVWVVFGPYTDELVQVVGAKYGRVPRQVIEIVHDNGDEQIQHQERTEEDERDEIGVRYVRATAAILFAGFRVARTTLHAGQHYVRPCLASSTPNYYRSIVIVLDFSLELEYILCYLKAESRCNFCNSTILEQLFPLKLNSLARRNVSKYNININYYIIKCWKIIIKKL